MDKELVLVVIGHIESRLVDLRRLLAQEAKGRGLQVVVLDHGVSPNLALDVPKLIDLVLTNSYKIDNLLLPQMEALYYCQLNASRLDKRVRNVLKLNRVFTRRSGERFRRRVSFPCCSR